MGITVIYNWLTKSTLMVNVIFYPDMIYGWNPVINITKRYQHKNNQCKQCVSAYKYPNYIHVIQSNWTFCKEG